MNQSAIWNWDLIITSCTCQAFLSDDSLTFYASVLRVVFNNCEMIFCSKIDSLVLFGSVRFSFLRWSWNEKTPRFSKPQINEKLSLVFEEPFALFFISLIYSCYWIGHACNLCLECTQEYGPRNTFSNNSVTSSFGSLHTRCSNAIKKSVFMIHNKIPYIDNLASYYIL